MDLTSMFHGFSWYVLVYFLCSFIFVAWNERLKGKMRELINQFIKENLGKLVNKLI